MGKKWSSLDYNTIEQDKKITKDDSEWSVIMFFGELKEN